MRNMFYLSGLRGLALLLCGVALSAQAAKNISLGTLVPDGTSYHKSLLEMRDKWRKAPEGGVNLRIYAGGKLGGEGNMVSQMKLGGLDAGLLTAVGLADIEPTVTGLQLMPMVFRSLDELEYVSKKLQPKLSKKLEEKGFVVLYWSDAGWVRFFSKEPAILPDDFRKMKLFTWAGDPKVVDLWKAARFQPVPLQTSDIVPMLDTGMINAAPLPPIVALAGQIYTRTPNMLDLKWVPLVGALVIRKATWDTLPAATQQAMREAAEEAGRQNKEHGRAEGERAIETMKTKGLKVQEVNAETEEIWRKTLEEWHPRIRGSLVPPDIFDEVFRLLEELRRTEANPKP